MLIKKTKKHALRVSQQVLGELELSRDTIEINDKTNKKVNNTERIKSIPRTKINTATNKKSEINNSDNNKQSNELNVNRTIKERLMKLERKFNIPVHQK